MTKPIVLKNELPSPQVATPEEIEALERAQELRREEDARWAAAPARQKKPNGSSGYSDESTFLFREYWEYGLPWDEDAAHDFTVDDVVSSAAELEIELTENEAEEALAHGKSAAQRDDRDMDESYITEGIDLVIWLRGDTILVDREVN